MIYHSRTYNLEKKTAYNKKTKYFASIKTCHSLLLPFQHNSLSRSIDFHSDFHVAGKKFAHFHSQNGREREREREGKKINVGGRKNLFSV